MDIEISTPALLFPAITLLMLAYTNRFATLATLVRQLSAQARLDAENKTQVLQVQNLSTRLGLIKWMQVFGVISFIFCVFSMTFLFMDNQLLGKGFFMASLLALMVSLVVSLRELLISTIALKIELDGIA